MRLPGEQKHLEIWVLMGVSTVDGVGTQNSVSKIWSFLPKSGGLTLDRYGYNEGNTK